MKKFYANCECVTSVTIKKDFTHEIEYKTRLVILFEIHGKYCSLCIPITRNKYIFSFVRN